MIQEYLKIIKNYKYALLGISIATAVVTFIVTMKQPSYYNSSLSLLVSSSQVQDTQDYRFDGYYTIQATDLFSNNIEAWLKSPEVVSGIFNAAKINPGTSHIKELTKIFKAEKLAPHYVEVRYKTSGEQDATRIASAITDALSEKTKSLGESSKNQTAFSVSSGKPVTALTKPPVLVNTAVAFVAGLFMGFLLVLMKEYWPSEKTK